VEGKGGGHFTSREISWKKWIKLSLSGGGGIGIHYFLLNSPTRKLTSTGEKISYVPLVYDFPANLQKEKGLKTTLIKNKIKFSSDIRNSEGSLLIYGSIFAHFFIY